jgi:hypothetical protein
MPTQFFLPVIHPAFELLKRSAWMLHFIATSIILINGLYFFQLPGAPKLLCYLQFIIVAELYLVLFFGKGLLVQSPLLNVFFRVIESLTLTGASFYHISFGHENPGWILLFLSLGYYFITYREWRVMCSESVGIRPTGISIPNFVKDKEIGWPEIKSIIPKYHSIFIETFHNKRIQFQLRRNLKIEELQQIDEFCRQHLTN